MCSWEGLLDLKNEKYVVSLTLIWAGLSFSSLMLLSSSWSICPQETNSAVQSGALYLLPYFDGVYMASAECAKFH